MNQEIVFLVVTILETVNLMAGLVNQKLKNHVHMIITSIIHHVYWVKTVFLDGLYILYLMK
jgi:hypothetical protein